MNIIKKADEIVNHRSEEKDRQYGPFSEGMERAAQIMSGMTGVKFAAPDMFKALIALKLSRESYSHREDNLLDAIAYLGGLNNYLDPEKFSQQTGAAVAALKALTQKNLEADHGF